MISSTSNFDIDDYQMDLDAINPVFGVSDKVRFKPACSATKSGLKLEIKLLASLDMIPSKKRITKVLIRLRRCCLQTSEDRFSRVVAQIITTHQQSSSYFCQNVSVDTVCLPKSICACHRVFSFTLIVLSLPCQIYMVAEDYV